MKFLAPCFTIFRLVSYIALHIAYRLSVLECGKCAGLTHSANIFEIPMPRHRRFSRPRLHLEQFSGDCYRKSFVKIAPALR